MTIRPQDYLPIEVIFNLLCVCRRGFGGSTQALRAAIYRRGLHFGNIYQDLPRLSFWLQLCRIASLLDDTWPPYPTLFADDWFAYPLEKQVWALVHAWISISKNRRHRMLRERLIDKLLAGAELSITYRRELPGLRAIGICVDDRLSELGQMVLGMQSHVLSYYPTAKPWALSDSQLHVPFPPKWDLLWQLEAFLDPVGPGLYSLSLESLRLAVQRGALEGIKGSELVVILENGLGTSPPAELVEALIATPKLQVLPGPVLEFQDPQELISLREAASFRRDLQEVISPRHVHLNPWRAHQVLRRLFQRGLLSEHDLLTTRQLDHPTNRPSDQI